MSNLLKKVSARARDLELVGGGLVRSLRGWSALEALAGTLTLTTFELCKRLGISQPTASQSIKRGERIAEEKGPQIDRMTYVNISMPVP